MKKLVSLILFLLVPGIVNSQSITERDFRNATAYIVSNTANNAITESLINLESEADRGFIILRVCINPGAATTAAYTNWTLFRTTTISSGGSVIPSESLSIPFVNKVNQRNASWSGIARSAGVEGASGTLIDGGVLFISTATTPNNGEACRQYCINGTQCPYIPKGVTNGIKLMFTATAGGASQLARIEFIAVD